jgi:hypothetical protein
MYGRRTIRKGYDRRRERINIYIVGKEIVKEFG